MRNPFSNKDNATVEADSTASVGNGSNKKKVRFRLKLSTLMGKRSQLETDDSPDENANEKPKKEKTPKEKKGNPGDDAGEKKKRPILLFVIIGVVAMAGGVTAALLLSGGPTVEEQLLKAAQYTADANYEKASNIYAELLAEDSTLAAAYLGQADVYLAQQEADPTQLDAAILVLTQGLTATQDPMIQQKLEDIRPDLIPAEEESISLSVTPMVWQDPALEKLVRQALNKTAAEDISEMDLMEVTSLKIIGGTHAVVNGNLNALNTAEGYTIGDTSYTERGSITTLADLAHFIKLRKLTVCYNQVRDLEGIAELTGLETLGLYFNDIESLAPLSHLTGLKYLYLYNNRITDISPLAGMVSLKSLFLQHNEITDISAVKSMTSLTELSLNDNKVTDISPIAGLPKLAFFYASENEIADISAVEKVPTLTDVNFENNPVTDYAPAKNIQNVNKIY